MAISLFFANKTRMRASLVQVDRDRASDPDVDQTVPLRLRALLKEKDLP